LLFISLTSCIEKEKENINSIEIVLMDNRTVFIEGKRVPIENFEGHFLKEQKLFLDGLHSPNNYNVNLKVSKEVKMCNFLIVSYVLKKYEVKKVNIYKMD